MGNTYEILPRIDPETGLYVTGERWRFTTIYKSQVQYLIDQVRSNVLRDLAKCKKIDPFDSFDPWDEYEGGMGWIDNEIGYAIALHKLPPMNFNYPSVSAFKKELFDYRVRYQGEFMIIRSVIEAGGTNSKNFKPIKSIKS
jgi:hypothetical protein